MPGDRKHHTDKFRRCVEKVIAKGHTESSAYAICTTSLQDAGEPIFEDAEMHHLHLLGATGPSRTEMHDGKEYLVVPVIALMEGVIHAVNADNPEFVPLETIKKAAPSWNGRPVTLGHPAKGGKECSANSPEVLESHGIGKIFNSRVEGTKLLQEAWIEKAKAKRLHPDMYARLAENKVEEVSVGAWVVTGGGEGNWKGKRFKSTWLESVGDHLAFLPGGRGACSVEMGCGAHRAAELRPLMHLVTAEGIDVEPGCFPILMFTTLEEQSYEDRISAVHIAVQERWPMPAPTVTPSEWPYVVQVFDDRVIVRRGEKTFSVPYEVVDGKVSLGEATEVKQAWVAARARYEDCPTCKGSGNVNGNPCEACDGEGEIQVGKKKMKAYAEFPKDRIRSEGGHWVLYSSNGSLRLGQYNTREEAEAHGKAIDKLLARSA